MPILPNSRHEKFAQQLATGKSATEAYALAGFKPSRRNASRLKSNEDVAARVLEIQHVSAASAEVTIESLLAELEDARAKATTLGQLSAAVRASAEKARISGLLIERQQIEVSEPDFTLEMSVEQILQKVAAERGREHAVVLAYAMGCEARLTEEMLAAVPVVEQKLDYVRQQLAAGKSVASTLRAIEDWRPPRRDPKREVD